MQVCKSYAPKYSSNIYVHFQLAKIYILLKYFYYFSTFP